MAAQVLYLLRTLPIGGTGGHSAAIAGDAAVASGDRPKDGRGDAGSRVPATPAAAARVQITCLHASRDVLACGTSTGSVYVYNQDSSAPAVGTAAGSGSGGGAGATAASGQPPALPECRLQTVLSTGASTGPIARVAVSPNTKFIALTHAEKPGTIDVINIAFQRTVVSTSHHAAPVTSLAWREDSGIVYSGDADGRIAINDLSGAFSETRIIAELEAPIVQLDVQRRCVGASTAVAAHAIYLGGGEPVVSQIGTRPRNGGYGYCFVGRRVAKAYFDAGIRPVPADAVALGGTPAAGRPSEAEGAEEGSSESGVPAPPRRDATRSGSGEHGTAAAAAAEVLPQQLPPPSASSSSTPAGDAASGDDDGAGTGETKAAEPAQSDGAVAGVEGAPRKPAPPAVASATPAHGATTVPQLPPPARGGVRRSTRCRYTLAARPGRRLWVANAADGSVMSTLKVPPPLGPTPLYTLSADGSVSPLHEVVGDAEKPKIPNFGRLVPLWIRRRSSPSCPPLLLSWTPSGSVFIVDPHPARVQILEWFNGLGSIVDACVAEHDQRGAGGADVYLLRRPVGATDGAPPVVSCLSCLTGFQFLRAVTGGGVAVPEVLSVAAAKYNVHDSRAMEFLWDQLVRSAGMDPPKRSDGREGVAHLKDRTPPDAGDAWLEALPADERAAFAVHLGSAVVRAQADEVAREAGMFDHNDDKLESEGTGIIRIDRAALLGRGRQLFERNANFVRQARNSVVGSLELPSGSQVNELARNADVMRRRASKFLSSMTSSIVAAGSGSGSGGGGSGGASEFDSLDRQFPPALLELLKVAEMSDAATRVLEAHASALRDIPLKHVADKMVTDAQALKDARRERLLLNGTVVSGMSGDEVLAQVLALCAPFMPYEPAKNAGLGMLRSASRTATGSDAFFAVQALVGHVDPDVLITPAQTSGGGGGTGSGSDMGTGDEASAGPEPVVINVPEETGDVHISAVNVFDVYRSVQLSHMRPEPWVRLRAVVEERGSLVKAGRSRVLTITVEAVPPGAGGFSVGAARHGSGEDDEEGDDDDDDDGGADVAAGGDGDATGDASATARPPTVAEADEEDDGEEDDHRVDDSSAPATAAAATDKE